MLHFDLKPLLHTIIMTEFYIVAMITLKTGFMWWPLIIKLLLLLLLFFFFLSQKEKLAALSFSSKLDIMLRVMNYSSCSKKMYIIHGYTVQFICVSNTCTGYSISAISLSGCIELISQSEWSWCLIQDLHNNLVLIAKGTKTCQKNKLKGIKKIWHSKYLVELILFWRKLNKFV